METVSKIETTKTMRTIFWKPWGAMLRRDGDTLHIEDLNPSLETKWVLSRWDYLVIAWGMFRAAVRF